jgi:hypothetical protein
MSIGVGERYSHHNQMENEISKRMNTWLDVRVFNELTEFCKSNPSGLGKWDYSNGIRILLMKSQYADTIFEMNKRIDELEAQLKDRLSQSETKDTNNSGMLNVKTFGKLNLDGENYG